MTHVLYRFFNNAGELLYVGITNNPWTRFKGHQSDKRWFSEVASSTMEHFETRAQLEAAEAQAIRTESPKHNIVGVVGRQTPIPASEVHLRHVRNRLRGRRHQSVTGEHANSFPAPDAIAEDNPPELSREHYPCLKCRRFFVVREVDDDGIPLNDTVRCLFCDTEWTDAEWVAAIVEFQNRRST